MRHPTRDATRMLAVGCVVSAAVLALASCRSDDTTHAHHSPAPYSTPDPKHQSHHDPDPRPAPAPAPADDSTDTQQVIAAVHDLWQDYADSDGEDMCQSLIAYYQGQLLDLQGQLLDNCAQMFDQSADGTNLTIGTPVISADGTIAIIPSSGTICGTESTLPQGECQTIADPSAMMPASNSEDDIDASIAAIGQAWQTGGQWAPDIVVKSATGWRLILPFGDTLAADPQATNPDGGGQTPAAPWTDQDWNQTCASGGCGVPGLPPMTDGGGLKF